MEKKNKPRITDILPKLLNIKRKKFERLKSKAKVDALFEKFYAHEPGIKIPYPNLFADTMIHQRFGDSINFDDAKVVVEILYILENQEDPSIAHQTSEQRNNAVNQRMIKIKLEAKEKYQLGLIEMFNALKKNSNQQILPILETAKKMLDRDPEPSL